MTTEQKQLDEILENLAFDLPPILYRTDPRFAEFIGLSPATMRKLDSLGQGPKNRVRHGKTVGYYRRDMIEWLRGRLSVVSRGEKKAVEGGEAA